jgi:hypothetical protein
VGFRKNLKNEVFYSGMLIKELAASIKNPSPRGCGTVTTIAGPLVNLLEAKDGNSGTEGYGAKW